MTEYTRPLIISVDGNIGSGKSTLVSKLRTRAKNRNDIVFVDEPVKEWENIKDKDGKNMIQKFYGNVKKYAFAFQMMAYISRLAELKEAYQKAIDDKISIIITERSVETDRMVFAQMLHDEGDIESVEFEIYTKWFDHFIKDMKVDHYVYIDASSITCDARIKKRNRSGENIPIEYLEKCQKYHQDWLSRPSTKGHVITIDGSKDVHSDPVVFEEWCRFISDRIGIDL